MIVCVIPVPLLRLRTKSGLRVSTKWRPFQYLLESSGSAKSDGVDSVLDKFRSTTLVSL